MMQDYNNIYLNNIQQIYTNIHLEILVRNIYYFF